MEKQKNIPKLRFPEFKGEWETKEIGEILTIGNGRDYKHLKYGNIPVFGTGGLMTKVDDYLYDGETVCIGRKGTIDKPIYFNGKIWTVDTLFYTYDYKLSSVKFIYNIFQRINWKNYNEASGVPSLSKSTIEKIEITIPTLPEQTRIASFFTVLDQKIAELKQKKNLLEQYKKGVMQKLFSVETHGRASVRFKDENGKDFPKWETKKLGDLSSLITKGTTPKYFVQSGINFIKIECFQNDKITNEKCLFIDEKTHNKELKRSILLEGDLLFAIAGATIGKCDFVSKEILPANTNQALSIIRLKENVNKIFVYYNLKSSKIHKYIVDNSTVGAQPNLNLEQMGSFSIPFPNELEQTKIANFLSAIDQKINRTENQIQKTQEWKKGLLQRMFV